MPTVSSSRTVTTTSVGASSTTVHVISLHGIAGAIFWLTIIGLIAYIIGFATIGWIGTTGLWQSCRCGIHRSNDASIVATQVFVTLGLIALVIAFILVVLYMFVHSVSKSQTILGAVICLFLCVLFSLIGFIIWGAKYNGGGWSYAITVVASILCLIAGILGTVQMRGGRC